MHLACKYQKYMIVKFFMKFINNLNDTDLNGKTPLHYAIQIEPSKCSNLIKPVSSLINVSRITNPITENLNPNFLKISKQIIELLKKEPLLKYTTHIKNTLNNISEYYPLQFENLNTEIIKKITNLIVW